MWGGEPGYKIFDLCFVYDVNIISNIDRALHICLYMHIYTCCDHLSDII